jgi:hypothetical protein
MKKASDILKKPPSTEFHVLERNYNGTVSYLTKFDLTEFNAVAEFGKLNNAVRIDKSDVALCIKVSESLYNLMNERKSLNTDPPVFKVKKVSTYLS